MNPSLETTVTASVPAQIVFWLLAALTVFFAVFTVTRRNPVTAVMSLVATFFFVAGIYTTLDAHFLAILQVLVYAGAIMVLFIFVVMILNREEVSPVSLRLMKFVALGGGVYLLVKFIHVSDMGVPTAGIVDTDYGTVGKVGDLLFRDFLYPFEAISLLLLVAIVGGVIVSRSHQKEVEAQKAADARKVFNDLALSDYPGHQDASLTSGTDHGGGGHH